MCCTFTRTQLCVAVATGIEQPVSVYLYLILDACNGGSRSLASIWRPSYSSTVVICLTAAQVMLEGRGPQAAPRRPGNPGGKDKSCRRAGTLSRFWCFLQGYSGVNSQGARSADQYCSLLHLIQRTVSWGFNRNPSNLFLSEMRGA